MPVELAVHTWLDPVLDEPEVKTPNLRAEGVTAIEAGYPVFVSHPERFVASACERLRQAGVRLWAVHAPLGGEYSLSHPDGKVRRRAVEYHRFVLERAALGAASILVIHPGTGGETSEREAVLPRLLESLEELIRHAERLEVRLALENLAVHPVGADADVLRGVVKLFQSRWLGICFDTGHAHLAGSLMESLETLRDRIITFHLADNDGMQDLHLQPGYGSIQWDAFARAFRGMDFNDPVAIEARPWAGAGYRQQLREVGALLRGKLLTLKVARRPASARCCECGHLCFSAAGGTRCACP